MNTHTKKNQAQNIRGASLAPEGPEGTKRDSRFGIPGVFGIV